MVRYRGFSAWITSGGRRLQEYEVAIDKATHKVTCWIPCEAGKEFTVSWEDHGSGIDSATFVVLDGFTVPGQFLHGSGVASRSATRVSQDEERPFMFFGGQRGPSKVGKELGTIILKVKQIKRTTLTHDPNTPRAPPERLGARRSAGIETVIGYGSPQKTAAQHPTTWICEPYDPMHPGSFVTFIFRYRPAGFLMDQCIMPDDRMIPAVRPASPLLSPDPSPPYKRRRLFDPVSTIKAEISLPSIDIPSYFQHPETDESTPRSTSSTLPGHNYMVSPGGHSSNSSASGGFLPLSSRASTPLQQIGRSLMTDSLSSIPRSVSGGHYRDIAFDGVPSVRRFSSQGDSHTSGKATTTGTRYYKT